MSTRNFQELLQAKWAENKFVCVGLDSELEKIPESVGGYTPPWREVEDIIFAFNERIVDVTKDLVCAYKPNIAFYEACGPEGLIALKRTIVYIHKVASSVLVILDAKRVDIGNTNAGYVKMAFNYLEADAITVNPYLGGEALEPFLACKDKGIFVLCRTSNPGAGEFQDIGIRFNLQEGEFIAKKEGSYCITEEGYCGKLYEHVAYQVSQGWNKNGNCGLVVGATYPFQLEYVRKITGDLPILIPAVGAQGGDLEASVKAAQSHFIINSSRGIIFASSGPDFAEAARRETEKLHTLINQYLKGGAV